MEYQYYNQFNLSDELAHSISSIISKNENDDYVCTVITVTIPEHEGLVFSSPVEGHTAGLSDYDIQDIRERYGRYIKDTIPSKDYSFFVVMKKKIT